ncbi:UDP-N-acetylenolpyruvoylglucosamine reductase, partial [Staphylococcus aureus]|nr:UDP-N-acetylenolpyruvoylglucosamine reductase [Staphylococcus aureus]
GLEWADNIPGTIGGAVYMNAGTVKDINSMFLEATIVDENGEIKVLNKEDVHFSHRYSSFMDHPEWIILETKLQISEGNLENMVNDMVGT